MPSLRSDAIDSSDLSAPEPGKSILLGFAICLLLLGSVFRVVAAGDYLWLDEQHTAWVAQGDLAEVAQRAADGNQTPLYFYASWAAIQIGGTSSPALRLPALISGLALMAIVSTFVYRRTNSAAALLLVSAFFAFDYDAVFYSSEARPYALVQLLGAIQALVFFDWVSALFDTRVRNSGKHAIATAFLASMIFYTHPTGMLLMVVELIFVLGLCVWHRSFRWRPLIGTACLCGGLIAPGVAVISFVWQRRENWDSVADPSKVFSGLISAGGLLMLLPLAMLLLDRTLNRDDRERASDVAIGSGGLVFIACWAIIPKLLIATCDAAGWVSLAIERYAIVGAAAFPIFGAIVIATVCNKWLRRLTAVGIAGWMAFASDVPNQIYGGGLRHENWKQAVEVINGEEESLPVFLVANLIEDKWAQSDPSQQFQRYLKFPLTGIPAVVSPDRIVPRPSQGEILSRDDINAIVEHGGGLVVVRDAEVYRDAIRLEITVALQSYPQTKSAKLFRAPIDRPSPNNVHVFLIKVPSTTESY